MKREDTKGSAIKNKSEVVFVTALLYLLYLKWNSVIDWREKGGRWEVSKAQLQRTRLSNIMKIAIHEEIQERKHNMSTLTGKISNVYSAKNVTILTSSVSSVNMFTSCFYH